MGENTGNNIQDNDTLKNNNEQKHGQCFNIIDSVFDPDCTVHVRFNNVTLPALMDTGASNSCISVAAVRRISPHLVQYIIKRNKRFTSATGEVMPYVGEITLHCSIQNQILVCNFSVFEHLSGEVLLGRDFMSKYGLKIDFGSNKVLFNTDHRVVLAKCTEIEANRVVWFKGELKVISCYLMGFMGYYRPERI